MLRVNYQISLYPQHENKQIERRVRKRHQQISEVGNLERTKNGTNKIRDMSKRPDYFIYYFNRSRDCPEGGSSNPGPGSGVHCGPPVRVLPHFEKIAAQHFLFFSTDLKTVLGQ